MPRVTHFEIQADDPQRAIRFYSDVFGWSFHEWEGAEDYWHIRTGPDGTKGINGGLVPRRERLEEGAPSAFVCTVQVDSIERSLERIVAAGGTVEQARFALAGIGWMAWVRDTERNRLGLIQQNTAAR